MSMRQIWTGERRGLRAVFVAGMGSVSKVIGRVAVVLLEWEASNTAEDGNKAVYTLTLREVLRAGLTIADATPGALALNGTGGAVAPGSGGGSMATPGVLAVVP